MSLPPAAPAGLADAIAIVGMAGRFPGAADLTAFWRNLREGRESIVFFTPEELVAAGVPAGAVADPDFIRAKGVIDDADSFDAAFFGYLPADVEVMDPQHRLFLECAWAALEDAGYDPLAAPGLVGVFGGMSQSTYLPLLRGLDPDGTRWGAYPLRLGTDKDYLTTRVSYKLNLRGPSLNVQTACSTSLVAVVQACQSLLAYQSDMALAGGVAVSVPLRSGHHYHEGGIFSPDGHCRPFDAKAQGTVNGDGVGIVVLKRLAEALADGDAIRAVIRGSALNNDGAAKMSFPAPSPDGQADAIATALAVAGVPADTIGYVEAHGTGTPLGDPIEIAGLAQAFRGSTDRTGFCAIGSVKGNIGHTDTAAGVAGLIKTVLALEHREIPATLHYRAPNAAIDFSATPFVVADTRREWPAGDTPRRAGVSGFGLGGTNAHVVLEEAPAVPRDGADLASTLLVVSARTPAALEAASARLADALTARPSTPLRDVAFTLRAGRHPFAWRRAVVAGDARDAARALRRVDPKTSPALEAGPTSAAFMFPGGGAQYAGMGRGLRPHAPAFRAALDECLALMGPARDLAPLLWPDDAGAAAAAATLEAPSWGLPALFAVEYALARQWMAWGVTPTALIGHSMGEYTAACLAGVMSLADALRLVRLRGDLFERLPAGGMLAVPLAEADVRARLPRDLAVAAVNAETSCVVAGDPQALAAFARALEADDVETRRLRIAVAAHSPMVAPILDEFRRFLETIPLAAPAIPIVSNLTGTWLTDAEACSPDYWVRHLRETVRFHAGLDALVTSDGERTLLEVGPGQALTTFARQHPRAAAAAVPSMRVASEASDDLAVLLQAAGRAWSRGLALDWLALPDTPHARRVPLPSYPFERQRYYPERPAVAAPAAPVPEACPPQEARVMSTPSPALVSVPAPPPRVDDIASRLAALFQALGGLPAGSVRRDVTFLEMGFDSLFLTQATLRIKQEFKVRVTFRQLFEDAPTIDALARFIDGKLPPAPPPVPVAVPPAPAAAWAPAPSTQPAAAAGVTPVTPPATVPANASAIERIVQEQLRLMAEQLRLLVGAAAGAPAAPASAVPAFTAPASVVVAPAPTPAAVPASAASAPDAPPQFGPFRGIDQSSHGLTPQQQRGLDALVARYTAKTAKSKALTAAQRGVLADPRAVGGFRKAWKEIVYQIATERSRGTRVWDIDGHEYLDLTSGFGVNLFGHGVPWVEEAVRAQLDRGIELGTLSPLAKEAADLVRELTGMERVSFANTGSEAMSGAIRAARTATAREWIAVFDDEYHGMSEEVLVKPASAADRRRAAPAAPGIPDHFVDKVIVLHWDDPGSLDVLRARADDIAAVIVEPVQGRHPDFRPVEMLREVRRVTVECDIPLIYDEMITGFRLHPRGAQGYLGVDCDLACYGKVMSGGLPIAVIAGKATLMDAFDGGPWQFGDDSFPEGGVTFFGGTFTRNSLSLAAAVAALRHLREAGPGLYDTLNATAERFAADVAAVLRRHEAPLHLEHCASIFSLTYTDANPLTRLLFHYLRLHGVHVWDRPFFLTTAHTEADLRQVVEAFDRSLTEMRQAGFFGTPPDGPGAGEPSRDVVPFTEPQMEVWLGSQMSATASAAFNEVVATEVRGALDVDALQGAVDDLIARHESLRMTVEATPPGFRVQASLPVTVEVCDHRAVDDAAARRDEVLRRVNREALDFAAGPLWRVVLVREAAADVLVVAIHHLICDGWSFGVLLRELETCYEARRAGRVHALPPAMAASHYARLLEAEESSDETRETEAWWLAQYRTVPAPLDLPLDRARPATATFHGRRLVVTFDQDLAERVRRFATAHRTTPFATLLAAFEVLVSRLSGQGDFVVGIPMAGQALVGAHDLIAHCVNFVAVRAAVDPAASFAAHVAAVTSQALDLNDHQGYTYLRLLHALRLPRSLARDPLVTVSFTLEPSFAAPAFAGLPATVLSVPRETTRRDLHVNVMETPAGLAVEADYNADILDEATVRGWLEAFRTCLSAALSSPSETVGALPLLTPAALARLTAAPERPEPLRFDPSTPLAQLFEAQAAATPDAPAMTCDGRTCSYADLNAAANRVAGALRLRGVERGTLVGVCLERGPALLPALLGVLKAGGAYLPIDLAYPPERLAFMLQDAGAPVLLTQAAVADRVPATAATIVRVDAVLEADGGRENLPPSAGPDDLAYVIYTSGTSGTPKGSRVTHRNVVSLMAGSAPRFAFSGADVWTLFHSYAFDFSVWEIWGALLYGGRVVVVPQATSRSPEAFYDLLVAERVTVLNQTPSAFRHVMAVDEARRGALALRYVVFGGEALDIAALRPWFERHGDDTPALVNMYGITETTVHVTYRRLRRADAAGGSVIGAPLPLWQVYLLDARQQPVPFGVPGEIYVGGAGVTAGYLHRHDLTAARFVPNPFGAGTLYRSGDGARYRADGDLEYLGRLDQQVKIRGFRVELGEIETVLARHDSVAACRVLARRGPGAAPDVRLVAYVQPRATAPDPLALQQHLRQFLPDYMVPAIYVPVDGFPLTANGKLDERALPDPDTARLTSAPVPSRPATPVESELARLWTELLGVAAVQRSDDFFDIGGHSLLAIQLVHRVGEVFGVTLAPVVLFEHSRLEALAAEIEAALPSAAVRAATPAPADAMPEAALTPVVVTPPVAATKLLARMSAGGPGAPFFWVHGVGGEIYSYRQVSKHLAPQRPVFGFAADWTAAFAPADRSVERIAAAYTQELIAAAPEGPYHLGGYCSAAVLMLEIARQLEARGRAVGAFAVLDYAITATDAPAKAPLLMAFAKNLPRWIGDDALPTGMGDLASRMRSKVRQFKPWREDGEPGGERSRDVRDELGLWRFPDSKVAMLQLHLDVLRAYVPKPFQGRAMLLLPRTGPLLGPFPAVTDHGWAAIARGGVEVHTVPGSHSTFLNEPFASSIASRIEANIQAAEARAGELVGADDGRR